MHNRRLAMLAVLSGGAFAIMGRLVGHAHLVDSFAFALAEQGGGNRRGKRKPRRHGAKLKACRNKISRRARRKHRRAA